MCAMTRSQIKQGTIVPSPEVLEEVSVRIDCLSKEGKIEKNGTGTLFSDGIDYFVITAAHCIQIGDSANRYEKADIRISLPQRGNKLLPVSDVPIFELADAIDFSLIKIDYNIEDNDSSFDYVHGIKILGKDEFGTEEGLYGYTNTYPNGRLFRTHQVASETYMIDENITASGLKFEKMLKGSSGAGVMVDKNDILYCLGYVKSRMDKNNRLDDIKVKKIPDINGHLSNNVWSQSYAEKAVHPQHIAVRSNSEIEYSNCWSDLHAILTQNKDCTQILQSIEDKRNAYPFVKSTSYQDLVINHLMRKNSELTENECRAFLFALQDKGLWPKVYGLDEDGRYDAIKSTPEYRSLSLRGSTFACGTEDPEDTSPDDKTDEGIYELVLRDAYKFDFDSLYGRLKEWAPSNKWLSRKAVLLGMYETDEELIELLKQYRIDETVVADERFIATMVLNVMSRQFPQPFKYEEFWSLGINSPSEITSYIGGKIDSVKKTPKLFGVHVSTIFASTDPSFIESIRLLQYIVNTGLATQIGMYNIVSKDVWMKAYRHLVHAIPYPTIYYTILYSEEKLVRWAGQMLAYTDDDFIKQVRPDLICSLLRAIRKERTPGCIFPGLYYMTQELYRTVPEDIWYDDFRESILDFFCKKLDAKNYSMSDALIKNLSAAFVCIQNVERRRYIFHSLIGKLTENPHVISELISNSIWFDDEFFDDQGVLDTLVDLNVNHPLSDIFRLMSEFSNYSVKEKFKDVVDSKIISDSLDFVRHDYSILRDLSKLAESEGAINKTKKYVLEGNMWNCSIFENSCSEPRPYHLESFDEKISWAVEEWGIIKDNMMRNIELIATHKHYNVSHFKSMYIDLLIDMKLFVLKMKKAEMSDVETVEERIESVMSSLKQYDDLYDAFASDDYYKIESGLNLLYVLLKTDDFESHINEINILINRVTLQKTIALYQCLKFICYLMFHFEEQMKKYFGNMLLYMLKNYCEYDFEKIDVNVPLVNWQLVCIAKKMSTEFPENTIIMYWTSEEVVYRFGGFRYR